MSTDEICVMGKFYLGLMVCESKVGSLYEHSNFTLKFADSTKQTGLFTSNSTWLVNSPVQLSSKAASSVLMLSDSV